MYLLSEYQYRYIIFFANSNKKERERESFIQTNITNTIVILIRFFFLLFTKKTKKLIFSHFLKITASFNIHNIPFLTPNNRTL